MSGKIYRRVVVWILSMLAAWFCVPLMCRAETVDTNGEAAGGVVRILAVDSDGVGGFGSGFGVGTEGEPTDIFVTNWHVVTDESGNLREKIYILLSNDAVTGNTYDPKQMVECDVIYITSGYPDLAIVQAKKPVEGRFALTLMHAEDARRGDPIYTLGFPGSADGLNSGYYYAETDDVSMGVGVISKFFTYEREGYTMAIQHQAHINHGSSGGPLVTEDGNVIGINTYGIGYEPGNGEGNKPSEYFVSIYVDYAMVALDSLGIVYDVYPPTPDPPPSDIWIAAVVFIVLVIALIVTLLVVRKRRKESPGATAQVAMESGEGKKTPQTIPEDRETKSDLHSVIQVPEREAGSPIQKSEAGSLARKSGTEDSGIRLQGMGGYFAGRRFAVNGRIRIGRDPSRNDLVYPRKSQGISSVHCEIYFKEGKLYLFDAGATYGTFLNGRRIPARQMFQLQVGDIFCLGSPQESFIIIDKKGV